MRNQAIILSLSGCLTATVILTGCQKAIIEKDYVRPLPPGAAALRKIIDPAKLPDLAGAWTANDNDLLTALDRSLNWFNKPSTKQFFPVNGISHYHAQISVHAFRKLIEASDSASQFQQRLLEDFDIYMSVGWDGLGTVLYTAYYSPIFRASRQQTDEYRYPLYPRPDDLTIEPTTGKILGRQVGQVTVTYPTRREIESSKILAGSELVYLKDKFENYLVQINGSAKLIMTDGSIQYVGYSGTNGHQYTSIGKLLVADGKLDKNRVSLPSIRDYFHRHPGELNHYILQNDRYVFFQTYNGDSWPSGSLGFKVTPWRTLATDKAVFPRSCVTLVKTKVPVDAISTRRFEQFMVDQDTGGAIRAAGRSDIFMGMGPKAEALAGRTLAEGRLYYFFLKPDRVAAWQDRLQETQVSLGN